MYARWYEFFVVYVFMVSIFNWLLVLVFFILLLFHLSEEFDGFKIRLKPFVYAWTYIFLLKCSTFQLPTTNISNSDTVFNIRDQRMFCY